MLSKEGGKKFSIPPKLDVIYENFVCIAETASYRLFEAKKRNSREKHLIRILDPTKDLVVKNFDFPVRLFKQELFYLHTRCPGSVLINTLEISKTGKQIACAVRQYSLVTPQLQEIEVSVNIKNTKVIEKLLNDVISDVEFLWRDLKIRNIASLMEPENIYCLKEEVAFFLGNWDKITEENSVVHSVTSELRSQDIAAEIKALAFALLKMKKVDVKELEFLLSLKNFRISTYEVAVKKKVSEGFNYSQKLQSLIKRMLSLDPRNLPNLEEFKIKKDKIQVRFEKVNNAANTERKEVGNQIAMEESKINLPSNSVIVNSSLILTSPTLIAWCSRVNNKIHVVELETKQSYVTFGGARISDTHVEWSWTYVKEIPNTKLLVSLHHNYQNSANMEIFDISKKGKANKIYSLGEVLGCKLGTGWGDVTYNSKRSILGAIPVTGRITYQLFTIDTSASNAVDIVKLSRKTKWHSQYSMKRNSFVTGFDFNPAGDSIATIDCYGKSLISDVDTNNHVFHLQVSRKKDAIGRCRWSTNTGEPILFVKYGRIKLNILDVEKKTRILRNPVQLEKDYFGYTYWIDVCQSNGNLLASGSDDKAIKIFDRRESKIVKTFEGAHSSKEFPKIFVVICDLGGIRCVRWNPSGDMLASTSRDEKAKLLDFKTGKFLHTGTTSDGNWAGSVCFI